MLKRHPLLIPLAWYLGVALGVPFLNGGYALESYYRHACSVLAILAVLGLARFAVVRAYRALPPVLRVRPLDANGLSRSVD